MKVLNNKSEYEIPEIFVINLLAKDQVLQSSLSSEELEDTTPLSGSW